MNSLCVGCSVSGIDAFTSHLTSKVFYRR